MLYIFTKNNSLRIAWGSTVPTDAVRGKWERWVPRAARARRADTAA